MSTTPDSAVRTYIEAHKTEFLDDLADWLRTPSVSADPDRAADVTRSARWLVDKLTRTGFPLAEIWDTPGAPAVFAQWPSADPDAPTILVSAGKFGEPDSPPGIAGGAPPRRSGSPGRVAPVRPPTSGTCWARRCCSWEFRCRPTVGTR